MSGDRARQQGQCLEIGGGECLRVVGVDAERADRLAGVDQGCGQPVRRDGAENVVVEDLVAGGQLDYGCLRADHLEREHGHDLGDRPGFGPCCGDLGLRLHDGKQLLFPVHPRQIGARTLELEPVPIWADRRRASAGGWFAASFQLCTASSSHTCGHGSSRPPGGSPAPSASPPPASGAPQPATEATGEGMRSGDVPVKSWCSEVCEDCMVTAQTQM